MKKFIPIIVLALSMSSCLPNFYQSIKSVSFQDASQNGAIFLSESNSVNFDYTSIASIMVEESSGKVKNKSTEKNKGEIYGNEGAGKFFFGRQDWRNSSCQSALNFAVDKCVQMGGDGIINIEIISNPTKVFVTGMVIKRK